MTTQAVCAARFRVDRPRRARLPAICRSFHAQNQDSIDVSLHRQPARVQYTGAPKIEQYGALPGLEVDDAIDIAEKIEI
jgi:hypothetical protein